MTSYFVSLFCGFLETGCVWQLQDWYENNVAHNWWRNQTLFWKSYWNLSHSFFNSIHIKQIILAPQSNYLLNLLKAKAIIVYNSIYQTMGIASRCRLSLSLPPSFQLIFNALICIRRWQLDHRFSAFKPRNDRTFTSVWHTEPECVTAFPPCFHLFPRLSMNLLVDSLSPWTSFVWPQGYQWFSMFLVCPYPL